MALKPTKLAGLNKCILIETPGDLILSALDAPFPTDNKPDSFTVTSEEVQAALKKYCANKGLIKNGTLSEEISSGHFFYGPDRICFVSTWGVERPLHARIEKIRKVVEDCLTSAGATVIRVGLLPDRLHDELGKKPATWYPLADDPEARCKIAPYLTKRECKKELSHSRIVPERIWHLASGHTVTIAPNLADLKTLFDEIYSLEDDEKLPIFEDVARAVAFMHRKGTVHHDIKPSNVLIKRLKRRVGLLADLEGQTESHYRGKKLNTPEYTKDRYYVSDAAERQLQHKLAHMDGNGYAPNPAPKISPNSLPNLLSGSTDFKTAHRKKRIKHSRITRKVALSRINKRNEIFSLGITFLEALARRNCRSEIWSLRKDCKEKQNDTVEQQHLIFSRVALITERFKNKRLTDLLCSMLQYDASERPTAPKVAEELKLVQLEIKQQAEKDQRARERSVTQIRAKEKAMERLWVGSCAAAVAIAVTVIYYSGIRDERAYCTALSDAKSTGEKSKTEKPSSSSAPQQALQPAVDENQQQLPAKPKMPKMPENFKGANIEVIRDECARKYGIFIPAH